MNVTCSNLNGCEFTLNSKCVFYEGVTLPHTGILTNDSVQTALQKIEAAIASSGGDDVGVWGSITGNIEDQTDLIQYLSDNYLLITDAFTNSAVNNELIKSDGTNGVSSGLFYASGQIMTMGATTTPGTVRYILTDGAQPNIDLFLSTKGTGNITLNPGGAGLNTIRLNALSESVAINNDLDDVRFPLSIINRGAGTPTSGIGAGLSFVTQTTADQLLSDVIGAQIFAVSTDLSGGASYDVGISILAGGSLTEKLRITSTGAIGLSGQYGTEGQVLTSHGPTSPPTWEDVSAGTTPGSDTQVLFNDGGSFGADAGMTYDKTTGTLTLTLKGSSNSGLIMKRPDTLTYLDLSEHSLKLGIPEAGSFPFTIETRVGPLRSSPLHLSTGGTTTALPSGDLTITTGSTTHETSPSSDSGNVIITTGSVVSPNATTGVIRLLRNTGFQVTSPTAKVHIDGGDASLAPLKIGSGTLLTTEEPGSIENDGNHLYYTNDTGTRYQLDQQGGGGIGGSTGDTDDIVLISDGTGGSTLGPSSIKAVASNGTVSFHTSLARTTEYLRLLRSTGGTVEFQRNAGTTGFIRGSSTTAIDGLNIVIHGSNTSNASPAATTGSVTIKSGDGSGSGDISSGDVIISTGSTTNAGTRGDIILNGNQIQLGGSNGLVISNSGSNPLTIQKEETNDDVTVRFYQAKATTTDATETTLLSINVPSSSAVGIWGIIIARKTGGVAAGEKVAMYEIRGLYHNPLDTAVSVGTPTITVIGESDSDWDVQLDIDGTDIDINVTGEVDNNITWHLSKLEVYPLAS